MANTTNFGWETPDDTDLVKDGASAMRTLGNAIDTSLVDLKGGTTGQVLSKTSNTDMDFTWVAQDDSNAIQNAIVDAKGDLISATAADTPARLASSGVNNDVLTVDTSTATGLKWAAPASGGMTLISTTTISAQATVTLSSIPQTYNNLFVVIQNFKPATDSSGIGLRFNEDSNTRYGTQTANGQLTFGGTYVDCSNNNIDNTVSNSIDIFFIPNYTNTNTWKCVDIFYFETDATTTTTINIGKTMGGYNQSSAISALSFISRDGGNITSGTILLYGVK